MCMTYIKSLVDWLTFTYFFYKNKYWVFFLLISSFNIKLIRDLSSLFVIFKVIS
jgi:hypothetical protein